MVEAPGDNVTSFSSTKIEMISSVQYIPLVKQESFLRLKYLQEGLSPRQIAALTFSSRQTVVKYLKLAGIPLRMDDQIRVLPFGKKWRLNRITIHEQELATIEKARQLRAEGLPYDKIAKVMSMMRLRTKRGGVKWHAKTVRDIILRRPVD
jgi:hypothetical protein